MDNQILTDDIMDFIDSMDVVNGDRLGDSRSPEDSMDFIDSMDVVNGDRLGDSRSPEDIFEMSLPYSVPSQIRELEMKDVIQNYQPPTEDLITSEEMIQLDQNAITSYFKNPLLRERDRIGEIKQTEREKTLLKQISICPVERLDFYNESLTSINPDYLKEAVSKQFFNPKVMESVMCLVDSFYYITPGFKPHQRVRNWISNLKRIGAESVSGYALRGSLRESLRESSNQNPDQKSDEPLFIIKTPRSPKFNDELIHEAFVGMFGLNQLRKEIPNFTYVYALFECSPALIDPENKNVETWCTTSGNTNYLVLENIAPAVPFSVYTRTVSPKGFVALYLQTLYAVRTALLLGKFTHYDLHYENVLIRDITQLGPGQFAAIPYNTERGIEYWIGREIATIIDYGRVHIKYDRENYGYWKAPYHFIFPESPYALYDAFKLLGFSMLVMLNRNNQAAFYEAVKILKFFNVTEDPIDFIRKTEKNKFTLPLTARVKNKSLDDLLTHIREVCDTSSYLLPNRGNYPLLYCDDDTICLSERGVLQQIGAINEPTPESVFQFCDLILKIKNDPTKSTKYQNLIQTVNFTSILNQAIIDINTISRILDQKFQQLSNTKYKINNARLDQILTQSNYTSYRKYVFDIVNIVGDINDIFTLLQAYECTIENSQVNLRYDSYVLIYQDMINSYISTINPHIESILQDIEYVKNLYNLYPKEINLIISNQPNLSWYWNTFPSFEYLKNVFQN